MSAGTKATQQAFLPAQVGQVEEVLFEQQKARGLWEGYTPNYTHVLLPSGEDLGGRVFPVRLVEVQGESVVATLVTDT